MVSEIVAQDVEDNLAAGAGAGAGAVAVVVVVVAVEDEVRVIYERPSCPRAVVGQVARLKWQEKEPEKDLMDLQRKRES
jgi:hypothetical protein